MLLGPDMHRLQYVAQCQAERRQRILHARRDLPVVAALDQPLRFHLAQLLRERAVRDTGKLALQLVEALRAFEQLVDDHHRPAAGKNPERGLDRTGDGFLGH